MAPVPGSLAEALGRGPVMADGGLSTVLAELGAAPSGGGSALWTGEVLATRPAAIEEAHARMISAGARVVLAAGYQVSRMGAVASGRRPEAGDELIVEATRRAVTARNRMRAQRPGPAWVAASIGPYGAALADGSEYRGRYAIGRPDLAEFHRGRLEVWVEAQRQLSTRADVWWCETIPDGVEAEVLGDELGRSVAALGEQGLPAPEIVVTMTVRSDGRCPTGEPVDEALAPILGGGALKPIAVGVNCCAPADVTPALERLAGVTRLPLVAKPNLGGAWNAADGRFDGAGPSTPDPERLLRWLDVGARLIGGCCGTGTAELAELADLARLLSAH